MSTDGPGPDGWASGFHPDPTGWPAVLHVTLAEGQREFRGVVTFVSPEANPVNGQVRVLAEIENTGGKLRPGLVGTLALEGPPSGSPEKARPRNAR